MVTAHAGTASGTSGISTFGEKDSDATLLYIDNLLTGNYK